MPPIEMETLLIHKATVDLWDRGILEIVDNIVILNPSGVQASIEGWTAAQLDALPITQSGFRCVLCYAYCSEISMAQGWSLETYIDGMYVGAVCPQHKEIRECQSA